MFGRKSRRIAELEAEVARLELEWRLAAVSRRRAIAVAARLANRDPQT